MIVELEVHTHKREDAYRQALSMASIPPKLWFAPVDAAERREKNATMPVATIWAKE